MRNVILFIAAIALTTVAALLSGLVLAEDKDQGGRRLKATLTGNEVPGPGDPDGRARAVITLNKVGRGVF